MNKLQDAINRRILVAIAYALTLLLGSLILIQGLLQHHRVENLKSALLNMAKGQEQALAAEMFMNQTFAISMRATELQKLNTPTQHIDATLYDLKGRVYYTTHPPSQGAVPGFPASLSPRGDSFDLNWRNQSLTLWHRIQLNDEPYGILCLELRDRQLGPLAGGTVLVAIVGTVLLVLVVVIFLLREFVNNIVVQRLQTISTAASRIETSEDCAARIPISGNDEIATLASQFDQMLIRLQSAQQREIEYQKLSAIAGIAAQVAHDIRSPLAALDSVSKDISQLPEEKRTIVRNAVGRIRDIANDLIERNRRATTAAPGQAQPEEMSVHLLSSLIDPLLTEKRLQFRAKLGLRLYAKLDNSYGLFVSVQSVEFKRVLSNLINNSIEALGDKGRVIVQVAGTDGRIVVKVEDDGKGIPPEVLARLGQRGVSHGKEDGLGLGLYHAKKCVEAWGGTLEIASAPGQGTSVTIRLPKAPAPDWFIPRLEPVLGSKVVVFDDDTSIHQVWTGRFESLRKGGQGLELLHFSTPDELRRWVRENGAAAAGLYLLDYEIMDHDETGLTLAEELGLGERAVLVTSRFEERQILQECGRLNMRVIPKGLAGFVPIAFSRPLERPDAVLIDDDKLVHMVWASAARAAGKRLASFSNARDFLAVVATIDKTTPVFVDSDLGEGIRGAELAKDLHARGFAELYLATGHRRDHFPEMHWIRAIVGKEAPWS